MTFKDSPRYTGMLTKWHEDYLKNKKWVQDFNNDKWQSFNDVARYYIATHYELWIPNTLIERCSGIAEIEHIVKYYIYMNKEVKHNEK